MAAAGLGKRGEDADRVLAAQRAYVEARRRVARFGLVVPEAFVRGIRDLGYRRNGDAIAELIDNSLQAGADRIDISFGYDGTTSVKKPSQLAVIDNGHGMEPEMIRMAVMWGGTHRENDRSGLGRYGYGLPCASVSLGRRFSVISKTAGGSLNQVTLDLDALADGDYTDCHGEIVVPEPRAAEVPSFVVDLIATAFPGGWHSGTIILLEKLDRLEWITAQALRQNLRQQFAVTYQKLRGEAAIYIDQAFVEPIDPLFTTPGFDLHDLDNDRAQPLDPVRVEVRDPADGSYRGAMTLRYAWLPPSFGSVDKARDAVGLNANPRFAILKDYHGLIFSRNGRLIDVQTRTPWTSFINNDRYIKVEIEFAAALDEYFGVTTAKQQVTVSAFIWDLLREAGLPKAIEQLRNQVRAAKLARRLAALAPRSGERLLSERAMADSGPAGNAARQYDLGLRASPYRLMFEDDPDGPFFRIDRHGGARTLHLNTAHRFYADVYDSESMTSELRSALELLLFSVGDVMLEASSRAALDQDHHLRLWSRRLDQSLAMMASHLARTDEEGEHLT